MTILACFPYFVLKLVFSSFFGVPIDGIDLCHLFSGLYIADKQEICRDHMGKYAVIFLDFKVRCSLERRRVPLT